MAQEQVVAPVSSMQSIDSKEKQLSFDDQHPRLTWWTSLMALVVSMGGLIFGYDTGQISGFLAMKNFLERFGEYNPVTETYYFSTIRSGLLVGLLSIGNLCGALIAAPIADRIGRKRSISLWCLVFIGGIIIQITSEYQWYQVVMGRWTGGLGIGALSVLVPMYQSETAPTHVRGTTVCFYQLFITLGILFANIINFGTEGIQSAASWRITMGMGFVWATVLGVGMLFLPESPKYAYRLGRIEEAKDTMCKMLGATTKNATVAKELGEMREKYDAEQNAGKPAWYEVFTGPRMAYRTLLGIALMSFQQLTGANFFFYYGTIVFNSTGLENSYVTQIILGTVNVTCTLPGLYFVHYYSRRKCLIWGALWMCACFLVFASVGHFALDQVDPSQTPQAGAIMIVFACLFIAAFASTWGPIPWGEVAALYPARYRAICIAIATAANWIWTFVIAFFTPFVTSAIEYRYGYVFAACCCLMAVVVYLCLLESQGRTLEELDTMYLMGVKPWESAKWVMPADSHLSAPAEAGGKQSGHDVGTVQQVKRL